MAEAPVKLACSPLGEIVITFLAAQRSPSLCPATPTGEILTLITTQAKPHVLLGS
jgi:hypothetical protein